MNQIAQPPLGLVFTLVGLPQFSETVYSPALPEIARALHTSEMLVEHTLTMYLWSFSFGMLFWGRISDRWGRRPTMLVGLVVYIIGCIGCYFSSSIELLMVSRFVQAFGGSSGTVLGQAVLRDVLHGPALSRAYAMMAGALGVSPAIGPFLGGFIAQHYGWSQIFLLLVGAGFFVLLLTVALLPETLPHEHRASFGLWSVMRRLLTDKRVMVYVFFVGCVNGIMFAYFAEAPFYLIKLLGLSPTAYGVSFMLIAAATMFGGWLAKWLHGRHPLFWVLDRGMYMMLAATFLFSCMAVSSAWIAYPAWVLISGTLAAHVVTMTGRCLVNSSSLSHALVDYRWCGGTASSIFGFLYYLVITACALGMGLLHNGTLLAMPLYFFGICAVMWCVRMMTNEE